MANDILRGLPFREDRTVISVMVDVPLARLQQLCAPDRCRRLPAAGLPGRPALTALFGARNLILPQPSEAALNAHLGVSALCSPILDQMLTAADWLADFTGDPDSAQAHVALMIRGYLPARPAPGDLPDALHRLSTEGGLSATLRAAMAPAEDTLTRGLDGFRPRLGLRQETGE